MHYRIAGDGPLVLLLHGWPQTGRCWHRVQPALAAAGYTVVAPDLRGYGLTDKPTGGSVPMALLELVAPQPSNRAEVKSVDEGREQRGLTDAWLALHDDDLRVARPCALSGAGERGELGFTPEERNPVVG